MTTTLLSYLNCHRGEFKDQSGKYIDSCMMPNNIIQTRLSFHVYPGTQIIATIETARTG